MLRLPRILVAVDFSDLSPAVVRYAAELARAFASEVVLCHVVEPPDALSSFPPTGEAYFPPNLPQIQTDAARTESEKLLAEAGLTARIEIVVGAPFVEIVRLARDEQADLVIVGTHGRGAVAHLLLGSVADRVIRKAPCPVLTVRSGQHEFVHP